MQTNEVDGCGEEAGRRFRPMVCDGNAHVSQRRVILEGVLDVGRHVDNVLDVVTTQTVQVARSRSVAQEQVVEHTNRERPRRTSHTATSSRWRG